MSGRPKLRAGSSLVRVLGVACAEPLTVQELRQRLTKRGVSLAEVSVRELALRLHRLGLLSRRYVPRREGAQYGPPPFVYALTPAGETELDLQAGVA